ncbi:hypothetical protein [Shinella sp. M31]|uniref:hypothetical protein n=1 Tax=Shinella sp. M31 TaxID=3368615 RepID=UPI003BA1665D
MDDDLLTRLESDSAALRRRAQEMGKFNEEQDIAMLMQGLATTMDAIRALAITVGRLDGLSGLGKSGD